MTTAQARVDAARSAARRLLRPIYRPLKRVARFAAWAIPALSAVTSTRAAQGRRVLIIYDTSSQPFSIGDLLNFQEASLVLCARHGIDKVDLAVMFDPKSPGSADPVFAARIHAENVYFHLASILPVAQVNPRLASLFVFDSRAQLQCHVNDNMARYVVWPSGWDLSSREYLSPRVFNELLWEHYEEHRSIPLLSCRQFLRDWATGFLGQHVPASVPVTVNLRNNKGWHPHRNSKIDAWIEFFNYCHGRHPVTFIIICARSEIDPRLRDCPNVILAKDFDTGVEQDLALIHMAAMHMGAGSGPATMAWFNDKPFLMVNTTFKVGEFFNREEMAVPLEDGIQRFWYANSNQRVANEAETPELLIREFERIWPSVDVASWRESDASTAKGIETWLR